MRQALGVLLLWSGSLLSAGCGKPGDPIRFGHLDSHGDDAEYRAIALAVDQTNQDPAKKPHERRVEVIHAAAGTTPEQAEAQAVRLASVNKVFALIGGGRAELAERIGQAAQAEPTLAVTLSGWSGSPLNPYLFPVGVAPSEQGTYLARHARDELKAGSAAVVADGDSPFHRTAAEAFAAEFGARATTERVSTRPADRDRPKDDGSRAVKRIVQSAPAVVYLGMRAEPALDWHQRLRAAGLKEAVPVVFGGEEAELAALAGESDRAGAWYAVSAFSAGEQSERVQAFVKAYTEKYQQPPTAAAALAYEAYGVLVQALRKAEEPTQAKVRDELKKKDASFEVLAGNLTFAADQTARRPVFVVSLTRDGRQVEKRYDPAAETAPAPK